MTMEVDTGAALSLISEMTFKELLPGRSVSAEVGRLVRIKLRESVGRFHHTPKGVSTAMDVACQVMVQIAS